MNVFTDIITVLVAVALVFWIFITSQKRSIAKALLPVWVLSAVCLAGFFWAAASNHGYEIKSDTYPMNNGYEARLPIKYKDGKAEMFGELSILDSSGVVIDQTSIDTRDYEYDIYENIEDYFVKKHRLTGYSVENTELNQVILYNKDHTVRLMFHPSGFLTSMLQGDLALIAVFALVRFHKVYRRRRNEMKRLRVESEL